MSRMTTVGYGKSRRTRIIRVAPITHAVRLALAASATVFALAGSGAALAQTCTDEANNTVYCDGAFAEPVAYENVDDLTLVLGANSPTSVTVTGESAGVLVSGTGTLGITSDADVTLSSSDTALGLALLAADRYAVVEASNSGDVVVEAPLGTVAGMYARGGVVADVGNSGTLAATAGDGRAFGIHVRSRDATVHNSGSIASTSQSGIADGMYVFGQTAQVTNSGTISASGAARAAGIAVWGRFTPTVTNCGDITATSEGGSAHGIAVRSGDGSKATVSNCDGDITVTATGGDVDDDAIGLDGRSLDTSHVSLRNHGSIDASAFGGDATGIFGEVRSGAVNLVNGGAITASSVYGVAAGMVASGTVADVRNSGTIQAGGFGEPAAVGILAAADAIAKVDNVGTIITGDVETPLGVGDGYGILVESQGTATVNNIGTVETRALYATGIAVAGALGVEVDNSGSIRSIGWEYAHGITAVSSQGDVAVDNSGLVDLTGNVRAGYGIQASADAGDVAIRNGKTGVVRAVARVGSGIGITGTSVTGDVAIDNDGSVEVINGNYAHNTYAIVGDSASGDVTVRNSGELTVTNVNPYTNWVRGVLVNSDDGDVLVHNAGSIEVVAGYSGVADGVRATSTAGDIEISNDDTIAVGSTNSGETPPFAFGIYAATAEGAVLGTNAGSVTVSSEEGFAIGIHAEGAEAMVSNTATGTIDVTGNLDVAGIQAAGDIVEVTSIGSITASSEEGFAIGIHAEGAEIMVSNTATGTIDVTAYRDATGIQAAGDIAVVHNAGLIEVTGSLGIYGPSSSTLGVIATGQELASVDNTGRVEATGNYRTIGIYADANAAGPEAIARVSNAGDVIATESSNFSLAVGIAAISADDVEVTNTGSVQASGQRPIGIYAYGDDLVIVNADTIAANGSDNQELHYGSVSGIVAFAPYESAGTIEVTTLEGSSITAESRPYASGIIASGGDDIRIDNAGDISAVDDFDPDSVQFEFGGSFGIFATSRAAGVQVDIDNSGEITVDVTVGPATGIVAGGSSIDIVNDGVIDVYSDGVRRSINATDVYGIRAGGLEATVVNNGDIDVGNGFGNAYGIRVRAGDAAVRNDGTITVTGGDVLYYGENFGIYAQSPDAGIQIDNAGQIAVTAPGTGNYGGTGAIGIFADGGEVVVTNTGSITADSLYSSGTSVGVATQGDVLTVVNHGDIHASTATADQYAAIGVQMDATTSATFNNTGTITTTTANGVGSGVAVLIESDGAINFSNTGTLLGAVITRGGDDAVTGQAGSKWTLTRQTTDLGAGDDQIRNLFGSTLDLDSGRIVLGEGRNDFVNHGLIRVQGDSLIDMGRYAGTGDSRGWNPFVNNGVIDLAGASNDDRLTLAGDLAGRGAILVGLGGHGTGRGGLVVEGSVRPGSVQTVNVQFAGFDAIRQGARTDFAFVQRDSTAGSFVGGEVLGFEAGNFLELGVDVDSQIDASNQRDDVFSARVQAEGLDDSGRLAASLGAGAQSLLAAQIGTWRQRSGVLSGHSPDSTMAGFVRSFGDAGELSPTSNAGQHSDFGFGQRNAGAEAGMHYQPAAGFSMGMRVGKSEGQQTLTGAGHGLNLIQADTFGVYGTWLSPKGLYVDTSAWRMDFDSRMQSSGSRHDVRGDASAVNVETGYAFRLPSGLRVEPSLQYTWTRIDGLSLQGSQAEFRSEAGDWHRARAGVLAWKPIHGRSGMTWTPYGSISVVHTDASGASYTVSDVFNGGTSMDGTSALLELGLGLRRRGFSANAGLNWTSGDTVGNALGGQLLLHYGW